MIGTVLSYYLIYNQSCPYKNYPSSNIMTRLNGGNFLWCMCVSSMFNYLSIKKLLVHVICIDLSTHKSFGQTCFQRIFDTLPKYISHLIFSTVALLLFLKRTKPDL